MKFNFFNGLAKLIDKLGNRARILEKLELENNAEIINYAIKRGLIV